MTFRSPLPDVEIPEISLTDYVLARAGELGDKPALIDGPTGRKLTYAELDDAVRRLAAGLAASGLRPGFVLAMMAPNTPEYAVVFHGVTSAGGVLTTINPTYTDREVHAQLLDSGAELLVTVGPLLPAATAAAQDTGVGQIYLLGPMPDDAPATLRPLADLLADSATDSATERVRVGPDDLAVLPYSSGTTGTTKGVMLTHRNLVANVAQTVAAADIRQEETLIAVLPFFHIYGMQVIMNGGLRAGATVITMPRFDLEEFLRLHQEHRITRSFVAPPIVVALAKHPAVDNYDLSALRQVFSGAAPLSAELAIAAGQRLGCEVVQGYGMTELSPVSHITPPGGFVPGSVGVTVANTELRVVDPGGGQDVQRGEPGELWIRGPQVMRGYLHNEKATELTIDEQGWLHTGDIGKVDENDHVFVVDRLKELIKYKGFQVPPAELEALLLTHPAVADAAVIGLADDEAGEVPAAFVVPRAGMQPSADEISTFVAEQVAPYKRLRRITFIDSIPKSASGKILRRLLRETPQES
jgi:acyl-CoA synthetase (AMP-forming)/AMP-acid ligase II